MRRSSTKHSLRLRTVLPRSALLATSYFCFAGFLIVTLAVAKTDDKSAPPATGPTGKAIVVRLGLIEMTFLPSNPARPVMVDKLKAELPKEIALAGSSARDVELVIEASDNAKWASVLAVAQAGRDADIPKISLNLSLRKSRIELSGPNGPRPAGENTIVLAVRRNPKLLIVDPTTGQPKRDEVGDPVYRRPLDTTPELIITVAEGKGSAKEVALKGNTEDVHPLRNYLTAFVKQNPAISVRFDTDGAGPVRLIEPVLTEVIEAGVTRITPTP